MSAISLLPLIAAVLSAVLAAVGIAVPARHSRTTTFFVLLNVAAVLWCTGYFLRLNFSPAVDPALARPGTIGYFTLIITVLGVAGSPTYWFLFGAEQAGWRRWTSGWGLLAAHVPLLYTLAVALTNSQHRLFVAGMSANGNVIYGPLVRPHHFASSIMGMIGFWLCLRYLWARPGGGRADALALGLTALPPTAASLLWMSRDATGLVSQALAVPVLQPIGNIVLAGLVFRRGLADIVPVQTLRSIMENTDALLAYLDPRLRFISANTAFLGRVGVSDERLLEIELGDVVKDPPLISLVRRAAALGESVEHRGWPDALGDDGQVAPTYWNWSLRPVGRGRRLEGFVFSLSEVTDEVRDAELNATLSRLTRRLHSTFDPETALPAIMSAAGSALETDTSLVLWEDGRWRWVRRCGGARPLWEQFDALHAPHIALALNTRRPVIAHDTFCDPRFDLAQAVAIGSRKVVVMPLAVRGALLGAVSFDSRQPGSLSRPQLTFVRELARAMAVALENARLYRSERRIAETLQDAMVSLPDRIEGLETGHAYRSATESARVGGDFYDLFRVNRDHVALVIGDVSGKGIQLAALTSLVRNTIRSEAHRSASPATILTRTNEVIRRQLEIGTFVTAIVILLDTETGLMRYASAGHPAPFVIHRRGCVERLEGSSVVLGAFQGVEYTSEQSALERGDVLMLFTDGLVETREPGTAAEDEMISLLASLGGHDPGSIVDAALRHATEANGGKLKDDVAVLAVRLL